MSLTLQPLHSRMPPQTAAPRIRAFSPAFTQNTNPALKRLIVNAAVKTWPLSFSATPISLRTVPVCRIDFASSLLFRLAPTASSPPMTPWPASKAGREYPRPPKIVRDSTRSSEDLLPLQGKAGQSLSNPRFSLRQRLVGRTPQAMKPPKDQMSRVYLLALATIPNGKASPQPSNRRLGILSGKRPTSSLVCRSELQPQQDQRRTRVRLFACRFRARRIHPLQE